MKKLLTTPKILIPILSAVLLVAAAVTLLVWQPWEEEDEEILFDGKKIMLITRSIGNGGDSSCGSY